MVSLLAINALEAEILANDNLKLQFDYNDRHKEFNYRLSLTDVTDDKHNKYLLYYKK
jgi:hypothetical protein